MLLALLTLVAAAPVPAESRQMLLSVSGDWSATHAEVRRYEREQGGGSWRVVGEPLGASLGRTGLAWGRGLQPAGLDGPLKKEGDGKSPAGVFDLRLITGYAEAPPPGTRLPYRQATAALKCVDDPASRLYNQIVDETQVAKDWTSAEDLRRGDDLYRLLAVVGNNDRPVVPGAGSCIFLHLRASPASTTAGCTAFAADAMETLLRWLDPTARPVLVQLPEPALRSLAHHWGLPEPPRPRARDLGIAPGVFTPGPLDAITDVAGVRVGQVTLVEGDAVRTGVTAILPHGGNLFQEKVGGAVFVGNAFGKLAGSTQVEELGTIETPIVLTNTLAVGTAVEAVVAWTLAQEGNASVRSVNAVVGETNDGGLNDIRSLPVRREHVLAAIRGAGEGPVEEGTVGAGTGTVCFGWKGGIGTASRVLPRHFGGHTVGVLVQSNFGGILTLAGAPVGQELGRHAFAPEGAPAGGSCMIVVATDAPLSARDLGRLAARGVFALARTGSSYGNGSGDFAIAFSTSPEARYGHGETEPRARAFLPAAALDPLFEAVLEATEEAVDNSLLRASAVSARGRTVEAIPIDRLREILKKYGRGN